MRSARAWLLALALVACQSPPAPQEAAPPPEDGLRDRARAFLDENLPERDRGKLSSAFLETNLELALQARREFEWARSVPEELFLDEVLPYAVLDEARDEWRRELHDLCKPIVAGAKTRSEAAQALNRELFEQIGVHYSTERERPNQSYLESKRQGKASCTGLAIILVEACRSVGIPARAVGTPSWTKKRGNHTWVEVWDGDWHFAGADEYDAGGLDRGWFVGDAADARADEPEHCIYATSWKRTGVFFPLAWNKRDQDVAAVDVTARYAKKSVEQQPVEGQLFVRVFDHRGGERIAVELALLDEKLQPLASDKSRAGTSDMNDMAQFVVKRGEMRVLRVTRDGVTYSRPVAGSNPDGGVLDIYWDELPRRADVREDRSNERASKSWRDDFAIEFWLWGRRDDPVPTHHLERLAELQALSITQGDKKLRWLEKSFGEAPEGQRSLWISLHGGGNAPAEVNDKQWANQIELYQPQEGFYVAPRAPTNTWNLWHEAHIDGLLGRLIEDYVAYRGVDPGRVYLLGYSAGGDGVWQLAPRMADRFAAVAMMAGHPNEASLLGLRNLPFAIFMGGDDSAYDRNKVARERATQLDALQAADPEGYEHFVRIYDGLGHWMQKKDAEALPWMAQHVRNAWPKRIVWFQDDVVHDRFYWLGRAPGKAHAGEKIVAEVDGQTIRISAGEVKDVQLWLSDRLLDLDQDVIVEVDGTRVFTGRVAVELTTLSESLEARYDPGLMAFAKVDLSW